MGELRARWPTVVVLLGFVAYVTAWSTLTILRFVSHHALVYDLGDTAELMWLVPYGHYSAAEFVANFLVEGAPFALFPVGVFGGYPAMLILQSAAIGGIALPIYGIATHYLQDRAAAACVALSSFLFFASAGANWYDFHFEVFFPILFLSGYYFLISGHPRSGFVLLAATAFVRFPYGVYPLLLGLVLVYEGAYRRRSIDGLTPIGAKRFGALLALVSGALLVVTGLVALPIVLGNGQLGALLRLSAAASSAGPSVGWFDQTLTLLLPLAALLFLPLFSPRWVLFLVPYALLLFVGGYWAYSYPWAFNYQYVYAIVPFLYLGTIDALARGRKTGTWWSPLLKSRAGSDPLPVGRHDRRMREICASLLVVVLAAALVFEPYGPLNGLTPEPFDLAQSIAENQTYLDEFHALANLIPRSDGNVLIEGNMPELFPRPLVANEPLVPGVTQFDLFTAPDVRNGTFPVQQFGKTDYVHFDYVFADQNSPQFIYGDPSMQQFVTAMYGSGAYGIVGEAGGMLLLKYHYFGPIQYYRPDTFSVGVSSLFSSTTGASLPGPSVTATNVAGNVPLWNGPYDSLMPGSYSVTFWLTATGVASTNSAIAQVLDGPRASLVAQTAVSGTNFSSGAGPVGISIPFYASQPLTNVQFLLRGIDWKGALTLTDISVGQSGAASVTFRVGLSPRDDLFYSLLHGVPAGATVAVQPYFSQGIVNQTVVTPGNFSTPPTYLLADPYSPGFGCATCGPNGSMQALVNSGLTNGTYGVLDSVQGALLLERGYTGSPQAFIPYVATFYPGQLVSWPQGDPLPNATIVASNISTGFPALWNGPFVYLGPGEYQLGFALLTSNVSVSNQAVVQILAGPTAATLLGSFAFNGSALEPVWNWATFQVSFAVGEVYSSVQFIVRVSNWTGTIALESIGLVQTAAG